MRCARSCGGASSARAHGWRPDDASYGGWGYYPIVPARPAGVVADDLLSSNLSATLLAIGALTLGGVAPDDPALVLARGFVERCQNRILPCPASPCPADGGFFFSPAVPDANKAGALDWGGGPRFRSYGSMTADGVRALLRLGVSPDDRRVREAAAWLERNFDATANPGDFPPVAEVRRASSYFYWAWTAAHALRALGKPELRTTRGWWRGHRPWPPSWCGGNRPTARGRTRPPRCARTTRWWRRRSRWRRSRFAAPCWPASRAGTPAGSNLIP